MGFFDRLSKVIRGNANAALDKMSDPAKEVELLVGEMEEQARRARGEVAKARATEKLCEKRLGDLEKDAARWQERAEQAVRAGDDNLAREALERKQRVDGDYAHAREELAEASRYRQEMFVQLEKLDEKIKIYKVKKNTIKAKATITKKTMGASTDAFEEFDRMTGKVDEAEAEADAHEELRALMKPEELGPGRRLGAERSGMTDAAVEQKFKQLEGRKGDGGGGGGGNPDIEARLAALKQKVDK